MEIVLNLAWALCSIGLIACWWRGRAANSKPVHVQLFALAMVVLLLLPVISLSDDVASMQGASETDGSVRRILQESHTQLSATPAFLATSIALSTSVPIFSWLSERVYIPTPAAATVFESRSFANRPPPQA